MHLVKRQKTLRTSVLIDMPNMHDGMKRGNLHINIVDFHRAIAKTLYSDPRWSDCGDIQFIAKKLYFDFHSDQEGTVAFTNFSRFTRGFKDLLGYELIPVKKFKLSEKSVQDQLNAYGRENKYKSRTDSKLIADATKIMVGEKLDVMIVVSGDSDLEFLSETAQEKGIHLVFIAHKKMIAPCLKQVGRIITMEALSCFSQKEIFVRTGTEG